MIRKIFVYLFERPKIKIGECLSFYSHKVLDIKFSWPHGIWYLKIDDGDDCWISWELELFYRGGR